VDASREYHERSGDLETHFNSVTYLVAQSWLMTALWTFPVSAFKKSFAREASFYPSIGRNATRDATAGLQSVLDRRSKS
jgi:hypothetical protein